MKIVVRVKNVYGNTNIYPVCEKAKLFAQIARMKTLNTSIAHIKALGYEVEVETPTI